MTPLTAYLPPLDSLSLEHKERVIRALKESEERFRLAMEAAEMGFWDWSFLENRGRWSLQHHLLLGLSPLDFDGTYTSFNEHIHPEDRPLVNAAMAEALGGDGNYEAEFRVVWPNGMVRWIAAKGKAFYSVDGRPTRMMGVIRDTTGQREIEEALRRQQLEQKLILDSIPAMVWFKDKENRLLRCNRAAADSLGRDIEGIEGRSAVELFGTARAEAYYKEDLAVLESGLPLLGLLEQLRGRRGPRWIEKAKVPYKDQKGDVAGVIVFGVDVTEKRRAEEVLRESEKTQKEFVANVSHEFRTPVAAIKGFAETLRRGGLDDARHRKRFVRIIESHADRLGWLVEDLLALASIESGKARINASPISLAAFVEEYARSIASLTRKKGLRLRVSIPRRLRVRADGAYLLQVIENLVSNAIKFNRPGGWIKVEARAEPPMALVGVSDGGMGIPEEDLPRVFDRFFRVERRPAHGHTGLGLHIVKKIVAAHGGEVSAQSRLGRGSTFRFTLPLA